MCDANELKLRKKCQKEGHNFKFYPGDSRPAGIITNGYIRSSITLCPKCGYYLLDDGESGYITDGWKT